MAGVGACHLTDPAPEPASTGQRSQRFLAGQAAQNNTWHTTTHALQAAQANSRHRFNPA
jgi:hypothetical protein